MSSSIFFGPPGTGKTTLARIIAASTQSAFEELSAVSSGKADVQAVIGRARERLGACEDGAPGSSSTRSTASTKLPQDGAPALCRVGARDADRRHDPQPKSVRSSVRCLLAFACTCSRRLHDDLHAVLNRARTENGGAGRPARRARGARRDRRDGGRRRASCALDTRAAARDTRPQRHRVGTLSEEVIEEGAEAPSCALRPRRRPPLRHDLGVHQERAGERSRRRPLLPRRHAGGRRGSGLHRAADRDPGERGHRQRRSARARPWPWFARAPWRRSACRRRAYALAQATAYLALAPKSNAAATSLGAALDAVRAHATARPPSALRDASYRGAQQLGSGVGYRYPHDAPGGFVADDHLPPELAGTQLYQPSEHGLEAKLAERLRELRRLRGGP